MPSILNESGELPEPTAEDLLAADEAAEILALTTGATDEGKPYWMYAAILPSKYQAFMEATKARQRIEISDYGRPLRYGFDAAVPPDVQEEMKREYGFDKDYVPTLIKKATAEREAFLKAKENARINGIVAMLKKQQENQ